MSNVTKTNQFHKHKRKLDRSDSASNPNAKIMKQLQTPSTSQAPEIVTFNRYAELSDNENDEPIVQTTKPQITKIPPIVVEQMTFETIKETMSKIGIPTTAYCTKYISIGIKIFMRDIDNYRKALTELKTLKKIGFTHDIPSEKTLKFVLSGLPEFPIEYLKEGLQEHKLRILDIKIMNLKRTRYEGQANYIVYFPNNSISLSELNKIGTVHSVIVKWRPYVSARNGPTQCNNCQIYGHGAKNCFSPPRCMSCGGKHKTVECPCSSDPNQKREPKCCLCAGPHPSNDRNCPKRVQYINIRIKAATKTTEKGPNTAATPNFNNTNFPPLRPVNANTPFSKWLQPHQLSKPNQTSSHPLQSNYVQAPQNHHSVDSRRTNSSPQTTNPTQRHDFSSSDSLFTIEELISISKELILALRSCRSKMDQFDAILSVSLKFGVHNV